MDFVTLSIFAAGLSVTTLGIVALARRARVQNPVPTDAETTRTVATWRSRLALLGAAALALVSLGLGVEGIERFGMSHVEVYVPGIDLPAEISEPPPRLGLASTVKWHLGAEPQPPGYFIAMWFWTKVFGTSLTALRMPSVLMGALAVLLIYAVATAVCRSVGIGLIAAGLLALNGHQLFWMQAARMYEMALCLGLLSTWLWIRMLRSKRAEPGTEIAYILTTLAGVYSQILFWPLLAAQMAFTLIRSSTRNGEPSRTYVMQTLCVILGTPMWAHALYVGRNVQSGGRASMAFVQDFLNFGFLYSIEWGPGVSFWAGMSLTLLALACAFAFLRHPGFRWQRTDGVAIPPSGHNLLLVGFGLAVLIAGYSREESRGNFTLAVVTSLAPLLVAAHIAPLYRLRRIWQRIETRLSGSWASPVFVLPVAMMALVFLIGLVQPVAVSRGMLIAVGPWLVVLAGGLYLIIRRWRVIGAVTLTAVFAANIGSLLYFRNLSLTAIDYRSVATHMVARFEPEDLIFVKKRDWVTTPVFYYLSGKHDRIVAGNYAETIDRTKVRRVWVPAFDEVEGSDEIKSALSSFEPTDIIMAPNTRFTLYVRTGGVGQTD